MDFDIGSNLFHLALFALLGAFFFYNLKIKKNNEKDFFVNPSHKYSNGPNPRTDYYDENFYADDTYIEFR